MAIKTTIRCDGCGKVRDPQRNHWWLAWRTGHGMVELLFAPWDVEREFSMGALHLCGVECCQKKLRDHMEASR